MDQGSEFEGEVIALCTRMGIHLKVISSHHPQSNGQVERNNREVVDLLTRAATDENWDIDLIAALRSLRWSVSRRHGRTPHEVMFGEPPRVPFVSVEEDKEVEGVADYTLDHWRRRQELVVGVREALQRYEAGTEEIREGSLVWVRNFGRKKFDPRWVGPCVIVARRAFSVKLKAENGRERVVNFSDVKPYRLNTAEGAVVEEGGGGSSD